MAAAMKKPGLPLIWIATVVSAVPLLIAPAVIRGLAALAWVEHYASLDGLPRPPRASARTLVSKTDTALRNLAPLPQASAAARRALEIGQRAQNQDRDAQAAIIIYRGVQASCASVRSRFLSGAGFAVIEARAAALERSIDLDKGATK
jgi:hypothetical protein